MIITMPETYCHMFPTPQVSAMEADVLGGQNMQESLKNSQAKMDSAVRDVYLSLTAASSKIIPCSGHMTVNHCSVQSAGAQANDKDRMRLIASVSHLSDISSKTVRSKTREIVS